MKRVLLLLLPLSLSLAQITPFGGDPGSSFGTTGQTATFFGGGSGNAQQFCSGRPTGAYCTADLSGIILCAANNALSTIVSCGSGTSCSCGASSICNVALESICVAAGGSPGGGGGSGTGTLNFPTDFIAQRTVTFFSQSSTYVLYNYTENIYYSRSRGTARYDITRTDILPVPRTTAISLFIVVTSGGVLQYTVVVVNGAFTSCTVQNIGAFPVEPVPALPYQFQKSVSNQASFFALTGNAISGFTFDTVVATTSNPPIPVRETTLTSTGATTSLGIITFNFFEPLDPVTRFANVFSVPTSCSGV